MNSNFLLKKIIKYAKLNGFINQSSEIYGGISGIYDYGHYGILLKNNIKEYWWKSMVQLNKNIIGIDTSIILHPNVWIASGHKHLFYDLFIKDNITKKKYKIDWLIDNFFKLKIKKYIKEKKNIKILINKKNKIKNKIKDLIKKNKINNIKDIIEEYNICNPENGLLNWKEIIKIDLMFPIKLKNEKNFLRPETAQGIFINYFNYLNINKLKIPFGVAQIGKSFRNEIFSKKFIFRMKEFEQMEMQFFINPKEEKKWYEYWKNKRLNWHLSLGFKKKKYRFNNHENLSHYAKRATDIEFNFPYFGFKELEGIHSRSDFDLKNHYKLSKLSKKNFIFFDEKNKEKYFPYIIETSIGLDRLFLSIITSSLKEEIITENKKRTFLKIPEFLSPIKVAIFPLIKKEELIKIGKKIFNKLKFYYNSIYEEKNTIGKRYVKQDLIGTPLCITIDDESITKETVTIRKRDNMKQIRIPIKEIKKYIKKFTIEEALKKL
ncbi:glycine--tRNA ligase [Candidatus Shikimatogenerans silvanidophilus]|uniref:glycine--tRNA ligase n=1 Tax=Candidatus Shikimatogenerans silvanidophilus TaxID=2782547 RepID=UPI001BA5714A|nr:glycine--tRNA ligase [Candidatus Shikimatogenerans silvanidophilus]